MTAVTSGRFYGCATKTTARPSSTITREPLKNITNTVMADSDILDFPTCGKGKKKSYFVLTSDEVLEKKLLQLMPKQKTRVVPLFFAQ